jgi:hypothetical protein
VREGGRAEGDSFAREADGALIVPDGEEGGPWGNMVSPTLVGTGPGQAVAPRADGHGYPCGEEGSRPSVTRTLFFFASR